jgi:hypothetical protein
MVDRGLLASLRRNRPPDFSTGKGLPEWLSPDYADYEIPDISLKYYGHRQLPVPLLQRRRQSNLFLEPPVLTELCPLRSGRLLRKELVLIHNGDFHHIFLGHVHALANSFRHFMSFTQSRPDHAFAVAHDNNGAETETPAALDYLRRSVNGNNPVKEFHIFHFSLIQKTSSFIIDYLFSN